MSHFEQAQKENKIFTGRILSLSEHTVRLEDGSEANREVVHHNGGVCVAALDEHNQLLLVRQFRFPAGRELLELPAGKLEKGENPMSAALRELEEETGHTTKVLSPLTQMLPTPAYCTEVIHIFAASKLSPVPQRLDEGEFLTVERIPLAKAEQMVLEGEILDGKTQVGILLLAARLRGQGVMV